MKSARRPGEASIVITDLPSGLVMHNDQNHIRTKINPQAHRQLDTCMHHTHRHAQLQSQS